MPASGGTPQAKTVRTNSYHEQESGDGRWLYFTAGSIQGGILRVSASVESESQGEPVTREPDAIAWAVAGKHFYFGIPRGKESARIVRFDTESGKREQVYEFPPDANPFYAQVFSLAVSRDERTIYYGGTPRQETNIMLVDHFR